MSIDSSWDSGYLALAVVYVGPCCLLITINQGINLSGAFVFLTGGGPGHGGDAVSAGFH